MTDPQEIVRAWCDAITRRDKDAFLALSHEAIAFYGPDGTDVGHEVVSNWFDAEPMRITIRKLEANGLTVRIDQRIERPGSEINENTAQIEVRDNKVYSYRQIEEPDAPYANEDPVVSP